MGPIQRRLLTFNQTMAGRLLIGPPLRLWSLVTKETRRVRQGDYSHLPHWAVHVRRRRCCCSGSSPASALSVVAVLLARRLPGLEPGIAACLHRTPRRRRLARANRVGRIECVFGLMYLYNNLHVAHHLKPTMPWYDIPRFYREHRGELLANNGHFVYRGLWRTGPAIFLDSRLQPRFSGCCRRRLPAKPARSSRHPIGNMLEWYDFTVYALFAGYIAGNFFPADDDPTTKLLKAFLFFGLGFVARPLGAVLIGNYGDRAGRKAALTLTILLMAAGTAVIAFSPTYASIGLGAPILLVAGTGAAGVFGRRRDRRCDRVLARERRTG